MFFKLTIDTVMGVFISAVMHKINLIIISFVGAKANQEDCQLMSLLVKVKAQSKLTIANLSVQIG